MGMGMLPGLGSSASCSDVFLHVQQTLLDSQQESQFAPRWSLNWDQTHFHEVSRVCKKPEFKPAFLTLK